MSKPEAGQWWETSKGRRFKIIGQLQRTGHFVLDDNSGIPDWCPPMAITECTYLPDCTGFDWKPADPPPPANQPDPDEWVVQDRVPPRAGLDVVCWSHWREEEEVTAQGTWERPQVHGYTDCFGHQLFVRCRRRDLPPEQCAACDAPAEPGTAGCKDCNEYATAICSPEPEYVADASKKVSDETELDKLKRHYEHRGRRLEALTKKVRTLRRALTDYKKAQDALERERQAEWMIRYAESLPQKPEPQLAKTRIRLWLEGPTTIVMCRDKAPYDDWREIHHDEHGFYTL